VYDDPHVIVDHVGRQLFSCDLGDFIDENAKRVCRLVTVQHFSSPAALSKLRLRREMAAALRIEPLTIEGLNAPLCHTNFQGTLRSLLSTELSFSGDCRLLELSPRIMGAERPLRATVKDRVINLRVIFQPDDLMVAHISLSGLHELLSRYVAAQANVMKAYDRTIKRYVCDIVDAAWAAYEARPSQYLARARKAAHDQLIFDILNGKVGHPQSRSSL
jgi:hypothetical protein